MGWSLAVIWNRGFGPQPLFGLLQSQLPKCNTHSPRGDCGLSVARALRFFTGFRLLVGQFQVDWAVWIDGALD